MYLWQTSLAAAWHETLGVVEMVVRHGLDESLQKWNKAENGDPQWFLNPASPLAGLLSGRTRARIVGDANRACAARNANPQHPRNGEPLVHDDYVAQFTFGNLIHLLPLNPPTSRSSVAWRSPRERLWESGATAGAFSSLAPMWASGWSGDYPTNVPASAAPGYAVAAALERLRRLRNRVGHHEQTLLANHRRRHKDAVMVARAVSPPVSLMLRDVSRVPRVLAEKPR